MPSVAEHLLAAREKRNLTRSQVASLTNIKSEHVRALEEGNYDIFSAPIYIRGFVRSISRTLKMDTQALMAQLDAELAATKNFSEPPSLSVGRKSPLDQLMYLLSKVQWRYVLPVLLVAVLVWIGFSAWRSRPAKPVTETPIDIGPGIYEPDTNDNGETLNLPPS